MRGDMSRTLRLFACAAAMLAVAVGAAAVLKDEPGYEAGLSEVSGKIVGLTEYQEGRGEPESEPSLPPSQHDWSAADPSPLGGGIFPEVKSASPLKSGGVSSIPSTFLPEAVSAPGGKGDVLTESPAFFREDSSVDEAEGFSSGNAAREKSAPPEGGSKAVSVSSEERSLGEAAEAGKKVAPSSETKTLKAAQESAPVNAERGKKAESSPGIVQEALEEVRTVAGGEPSVPQKAQPRYERVVTSAKFSMKGSLIKLVLQGNAPMVGHCSILGNPDRVVLDLAGNWELEAPRVPSNRLVQAVRVGQHEDKTRIVLDMKTMGKVALVPVNRNALELSIQ